jgi:tetratricopeptide (TPR) repeat protein
MTAPLESSIVRFRKSNGAVVGAGFLVSKKHVLTCAHVVADALGIARDTQDIPTEDVYLDFPLVGSETQLTARVVFWSPVPPKGSTSVKDKEDIAGLELNNSLPEGVQPVKLIIKKELREHPFRTFGFPSGHDDGLEATGVLRGRQATGWVQLEDVKQTGVRLEPGFSGAPVWDEKLKGIVGMAVAADQKRPEAKVAFMIPTEVLETAWEDLDKLTISPLRPPIKSFQLWRDCSFLWVSLFLFPLFFGGLFLAVPKSSTLLEVNKCENMSKKPNSFRIAIANFYNTSKDSDTILLTEKRLLDRLEADKPDKVEICLANETVSTSKEAQAVGEKLGATIVIWGRWDTSSYDVFLKGIETELVYLSALSVQSANASEYKLQTKDLPGLLNVMVAYAISQAYYSNGQIPMAREVLANALEVADARKLYTNNSNAERLGEAYFLLGVMFDADIDSGCENTLEDCRNAIRFYREASKLNRKLYLALLNQGLLHKQLKEFDQAVAAFSQIINSDSESPSAVGARIHRAEILLAQDKSETALKDLEIVCQQDPEELLYRHFLGLAQLQAGQTLEAEQTYQHIKRYIGEDNELKSQIMEDLNLLAKKEENVTLITTIITLFQSL